MSEQIKALQDMINDHARRMSEIEREASALRAKIERLERIQTAQEQATRALGKHLDSWPSDGRPFNFERVRLPPGG